MTLCHSLEHQSIRYSMAQHSEDSLLAMTLQGSPLSIAHSPDSLLAMQFQKEEYARYSAMHPPTMVARDLSSDHVLLQLLHSAPSHQLISPTHV